MEERLRELKKEYEEFVDRVKKLKEDTIKEVSNRRLPTPDFYEREAKDIRQMEIEINMATAFVEALDLVLEGAENENEE